MSASTSRKSPSTTTAMPTRVETKSTPMRKRIPIEEIGMPMHTTTDNRDHVPPLRQNATGSTFIGSNKIDAPKAAKDLLEPSAPTSMVQEILAEREAQSPKVNYNLKLSCAIFLAI